MSGTSSGTNGGTQRYSVPQVARMLGISERAVRKRIDAGTLQAERDGRQWWITLKEPPPEPEEAVPSGTVGGTETEPTEPVSGTSSEPIDVDYRPAIETSRRYLEELRDEWLRPLISEMGDLREDLGRERTLREITEAERESERRRAEHAESERDQLRMELETATALLKERETARLKRIDATESVEQASEGRQMSGTTNEPLEGTTRPWWQFWKGFRE